MRLGRPARTLRYPGAMAADPELKQKVEQAIAENPILLLMKGTPDMPRCGFSMRVVNVLEQIGVEYGAIDVLPALQPLREVTTEIADWQTFPQLYVKGELVGGADIVEEMLDTGELAQLLDVEQPPEAQLPEPERILPGGSQTSPPMPLG
jgi:monothiol glutaredoxin